MMGADGMRSTMFMWDLQIFYVEFIIDGAKLKDIHFFKPSRMQTNYMAAEMGSSGVNSITMAPKREEKIEWNPFYDPDLMTSFMEKFAPMAVTRRIDP